MCIRDSYTPNGLLLVPEGQPLNEGAIGKLLDHNRTNPIIPVSYTHLRAHETVLDLVCRLLLEKKKKGENHFDMVHIRTRQIGRSQPHNVNMRKQHERENSHI